MVGHLVKKSGERVSARDLKYAVLHLQAAVEVLLKARLQQEHWSLVFRNPGVAVRSRFESGDFESCGTSEAIDRLRDIVGIHLKDKDVKALHGLAKTRNGLQHYGLAASGPATEAQAAAVLDFLKVFLDEQLLGTFDAADLARIDRQYMDHIRAGLADVKSFVAKRMKRLRSELDEYSPRVVVCPTCCLFALLVDGDANRCHFCGIDWFEDAAGQVASLQGGFVAPRVCPGCESEALVRDVCAAYDPSSPVDLCFNCSEEFEGLVECGRCPRLFQPNNRGEDICDACGQEDDYEMRNYYARLVAEE
ncbi:hypothetical protein [Streptomyces flavofungini]|uniref:hypothetical protein n=1 Tax=Streptomyces flavofungini TaxID=68200 RepID=UPI0025AF4547|nr:hypothetical protein [Streptomyces flavofungini]WJV48875.1 hypothetical protein QUY26_27210 [Streptomyces flavofungini]